MSIDSGQIPQADVPRLKPGSPPFYVLAFIFSTIVPGVAWTTGTNYLHMALSAGHAESQVVPKFNAPARLAPVSFEASALGSAAAHPAKQAATNVLLPALADRPVLRGQRSGTRPQHAPQAPVREDLPGAATYPPQRAQCARVWRQRAIQAASRRRRQTSRVRGQAPNRQLVLRIRAQPAVPDRLQPRTHL